MPPRPYGLAVRSSDDPGQATGAGFSPSDPGTPRDGRSVGSGEVGDGVDVPGEELLLAVEELLGDLLIEGDATG